MSELNEKPRVITKTLKELGPNLPLGIKVGEEYHKKLDVRRWSFKEEKKLAKLHDDNRSNNVAQWVSTVLSQMYKTIGCHNFESAGNSDETLYKIGQMYGGDVFYAYVWLRVQALGKELPVKLNCRLCKKPFTSTADLETTEIVTAEKSEDLFWDYMLEDPFEIRGKKVEGFQMGPHRWYTFESIGQHQITDAIAKCSTIRGSIQRVYGVDGPLTLSDDELDEMTKRDIEGIVGRLAKSPLGPNMLLEMACPYCGTEIETAIEWGYKNFFEASSL